MYPNEVERSLNKALSNIDETKYNIIYTNIEYIYKKSENKDLKREIVNSVKTYIPNIKYSTEDHLRKLLLFWIYFSNNLDGNDINNVNIKVLINIFSYHSKSHWEKQIDKKKFLLILNELINNLSYPYAINESIFYLSQRFGYDNLSGKLYISNISLISLEYRIIKLHIEKSDKFNFVSLSILERYSEMVYNYQESLMMSISRDTNEVSKVKNMIPYSIKRKLNNFITKNGEEYLTELIYEHNDNSLFSTFIWKVFFDNNEYEQLLNNSKFDSIEGIQSIRNLWTLFKYNKFQYFTIDKDMWLDEGSELINKLSELLNVEKEYIQIKENMVNIKSKEEILRYEFRIKELENDCKNINLPILKKQEIMDNIQQLSFSLSANYVGVK